MIIKDFNETTIDSMKTTVTLQAVVNMMDSDRVYHIVLLEESRLVGIVTERDVVWR